MPRDTSDRPVTTLVPSRPTPGDNQPNGDLDLRQYLKIDEAFFCEFRGWITKQRTSRPDSNDCDVPHWDADRRELSYGGRVVLRYKRSAPNQEAILTDFEQQGWPRRVDYPLHRCCIAETIGDLQKKCKAEGCPVVFNRDGTGNGLQWRRNSDTDIT